MTTVLLHIASLFLKLLFCSYYFPLFFHRDDFGHTDCHSWTRLDSVPCIRGKCVCVWECVGFHTVFLRSEFLVCLHNNRITKKKKTQQGHREPISLRETIHLLYNVQNCFWNYFRCVNVFPKWLELCAYMCIPEDPWTWAVTWSYFFVLLFFFLCHEWTFLPSTGIHIHQAQYHTATLVKVKIFLVGRSAPKLNGLFVGQCYTRPPSFKEIGVVGFVQ